MLVCLTASHKTASFSVLERLVAECTNVAPVIQAESPAVSGSVVLATCNRFEAYIDVPESLEDEGAERAIAAAYSVLTQSSLLNESEVHNSFAVRTGRDAAEHLFAVSAGLESVAVGEDEIAGQVRRAIIEARTEGTATADLERLFQRASQTSRQVKNNTPLGRTGRSLVHLALDLAESRFADWASTHVLLIGTGAYAGASLAALHSRGAKQVSVYSHSGRASAFALARGLEAVDEAGLLNALSQADIVVTCTSADDYVIDSAMMTNARTLLGRTRNQLLIDLGLPHNVNPNVTSTRGVELLDLETLRLHAPLEELQATERARELVKLAADSFVAGKDAQRASAAVTALRSHVFDVLDDELEKLQGRDHDGAIERALRHFAGVLLHEPTIRARESSLTGDAETYVQALQTVFGIATDSSDPSEGASGSSTDAE